MYDFDAMVKNEEMKDVILFLVGRREQGMSHPSLDRFFYIHKASEKYESYNIRLINEAENLKASQELIPGYKTGPNWKAPDFMVENKYYIR
ncbi:hypothetical protein [Pantoea sp. BAV 3049]|uniref:hypothetical protein n=1 Tax=Pantoea sp. BAV 3049 TaxID=2654188 RepID=UPI00131E6334|nr:hypothetical protein [Pantoea sp. BAV 3049]